MGRNHRFGDCGHVCFGQPFGGDHVVATGLLRNGKRRAFYSRRGKNSSAIRHPCASGRDSGDSRDSARGGGEFSTDRRVFSFYGGRVHWAGSGRTVRAAQATRAAQWRGGNPRLSFDPIRLSAPDGHHAYAACSAQPAGGADRKLYNAGGAAGFRMVKKKHAAEGRSDLIARKALPVRAWSVVPSWQNLIDLIPSIVRRIVECRLRGLLTDEPERVSQEATVQRHAGASRGKRWKGPQRPFANFRRAEAPCHAAALRLPIGVEWDAALLGRS